MVLKLLLLKLLALQLLWLGSAAFYCSSQKQQLLAQPLARPGAVLLLVLGAGLSIVLLAQVYHWLSASFAVLALLMFCWSFLALLAAHCRNAISTLTAGSFVMALLALSGAGNVA